MRQSAWVALSCGLFVATVAIIVLFGWLYDLETAKRVLPGLSSMKVNTALCFLLGAGALFTALGGRRTVTAKRIRQSFALLVLLIAGATLVEYALALDLGIDQGLLADAENSPGSNPGRMSVLTAIYFILFGVAMILPGRYTARFDRLTTALLTVGLLGSVMAVVGYAFGASFLYRPVPATSLALNTAIAFVVLFVGAFATRPEAGWLSLLRTQGVGSTMARRLIPVIVLLPPLVGWIVLQGVKHELYDPTMGFALMATLSALVISTIVWQNAAGANRTDQSLRRREIIQRTILETALDAFVLMDDDGRVLEWNPGAERVFGWSRGEALGRLLEELVVPPDQRAAHRSGLERFLATGEEAILKRRNEVTAWRRDGTAFPAELLILPIDMGDHWLFSGFVRDITARKETEAQLLQAQKMETVGQLTGGLAHDFNNMLTVLLGNLDLMKTRAPAELQPQIALMTKASERTAALIDRLMAFSRRKPLQPEELDLKQLVTEMMDLLRRSLGESVQIEVVANPDHRPVMADRAQVETALLNLALNARDAMPSGGMLTIEIDRAYLDEGYAASNAEVTPGDYTVIAVSDTGEGMSRDVASRAFEPFFTTKEVGKGSGLGLSMVYGFAKQSQGHVKIYSELGHGTTVRLYLPCSTEPSDHVGRGAEEKHEALGGGEVILVVEDDPLVREMVIAQLSGLGYRVIEAANGREALEVLEGDHPVDLIFTDVVMPGGITGRQLVDSATVTRPGIRALFTSGYTQNSIVHHGRLDPGVEFLAKPYKQWELALRIREILDRR